MKLSVHHWQIENWQIKLHTQLSTSVCGTCQRQTVYILCRCGNGLMLKHLYSESVKYIYIFCKHKFNCFNEVDNFIHFLWLHVVRGYFPTLKKQVPVQVWQLSEIFWTFAYHAWKSTLIWEKDHQIWCTPSLMILKFLVQVILLNKLVDCFVRWILVFKKLNVKVQIYVLITISFVEVACSLPHVGRPN